MAECGEIREGPPQHAFQTLLASIHSWPQSSATFANITWAAAGGQLRTQVNEPNIEPTDWNASVATHAFEELRSPPSATGREHA